MEGFLLLSLSDGLVIEQVGREDQQVVVSVRSAASLARCPLCATASEAIHSHYQRTVADLPEVGQLVILKLRVRRFFCRNALCARRIFIERLASAGSAVGADDESASRSTACLAFCHLR
ncbi:MAG: transposase family protein [Ktedonobacteraceae bacterium]|nr:transposase family protein [Ktedonobacteraceae bacterium]MBO0794116.1 transposase family protein [Ktedonobacteraceae bacterium]